MNQFPQNLRPLRAEEKSLVRLLAGCAKVAEFVLSQLEGACVRDLQDGGMRSIEFAGDGNRSLGKILAEAEYLDSDGAPVSIVLNADQNGRLFELDIWKVDFSPLKLYPASDRIQIKG